MANQETKTHSYSLVNRGLRMILQDENAAQIRGFECAFTLTFLLWMGRCFLTWEDWLTNRGFHLHTIELMSMGYPNPIDPMGGWQVLLFALTIVLGAMLLLWPLRWHTTKAKWPRRTGLILLTLSALAAQKVDPMASFTLNKLYVGLFTLLALAPGIQICPLTGELRQPMIVRKVMQSTLVLQYFAAGLAKMDGDWLHSHDILWEHAQGVYRTELAAWALRTMPRWTWTAQQYASLFFEVGAPVLFCLARLRPLAFTLGIGFHLMIALMMKDLIFFSAQMWSFYALFVTADQWRWLGERATKIWRFFYRPSKVTDAVA